MGNSASVPQEQGSAEGGVGGGNKVIIVGCGIAGCTLALQLLKKGRDFILINPTDYFHVVFAAVRAPAVPGWAEKTLVPISPMFGDRFKQGKVVKVIPGEEGTKRGKVILESGEEIEYGYLVIATGTNAKWPVRLYDMPKEDVLQRYQELAEKVKESSKIVIVGGGATGVEIAAEIKSEYPDESKEVTIVNSKNNLVAPFSDQSQQALQTQLKDQFEIKIVLNERVSNLGELESGKQGTVKTENGLEIQGDVVIVVIGDRVIPTAYQDGLASSVDESGRLIVDTSFRVKDHQNIFAIGDCTNLEEPKVGALAMEHGKLLAKSILNLDRGKAMCTYKPDNFIFVGGVALGPNSAFARMKPDRKFPVFVMKRLKCKHLFTNQWWNDMKQKCPV